MAGVGHQGDGYRMLRRIVVGCWVRADAGAEALEEVGREADAGAVAVADGSCKDLGWI